MLSSVSFVLGFALVAGVLWEAFETVVLPRRVTRRFRLTRVYYRLTWAPWSRAGRTITRPKRREAFLGVYGPISLVLLLAIWAFGLILGFALLYRGLGSPFTGLAANFGTDLYFSGTTLFTLGMGDVAPLSTAARALAVIQAGVGFGFLAIVIGYLPVIYQSFSRREVIISMLDARAGSPPTAAELVRRHVQDYGFESLNRLLRDWEEWSAELLESHLSYPVLAYFRSQHDNQSWLASLTTLLDASALVMAGMKGEPAAQARLTFAMARHAVVDLSQIFATKPRPSDGNRLTDDDYHLLIAVLASHGVHLDEATTHARLLKLRSMYEPYVQALSVHLSMSLPRWMPPVGPRDNWQTSMWET